MSRRNYMKEGKMEGRHDNGSRYAVDKPKNCKFCYFGENRNVGCIRGEENCYYLLSKKTKPLKECDVCPYGRASRCVGWCTKKLIQEREKARNRDTT